MMGFKVNMKKIVAFLLLVCMMISVLPLGQVQAAKTVKLNKTALSMKAGETYQLKLSGATKVGWTTSNKAVATVSYKGVVSAIDNGTATITAKDKKTGKTYKCKVTVKNTMYLDKESVFIDEPGQTGSFKLLNSKSTTYKSWNTKIATVDKNGKITGVAPGTCNVVAINNVTKKVYKCSVTVAVGKITYNLFNKKNTYNELDSESVCKYVKDHFGIELNPLYKVSVYDKDYNKMKTDVLNLYDDNTIVRTFGNMIQVKYVDTYYLLISGKYWFKLEVTDKDTVIDSIVKAKEIDFSNYDALIKSATHASKRDFLYNGLYKSVDLTYDSSDSDQFDKLIIGKTTRDEFLSYITTDINQFVSCVNRDDFEINYNHADYNLSVFFEFENDILKTAHYYISKY